MDQFKYEAFLQEFPFLRELLRRRHDIHAAYTRQDDGQEHTFPPRPWAELETRLHQGWRIQDVFTGGRRILVKDPESSDWIPDGAIVIIYRDIMVRPDTIRVFRADENLLVRTPYQKSEVHFVLQDGTILENAVRTGWWDPVQDVVTNEGETILESLSRLQNPDDVSYIVWVDMDVAPTQKVGAYEGMDVFVTSGPAWVGIYKPPKREKFADYITRARAHALAGVRLEG